MTFSVSSSVQWGDGGLSPEAKSCSSKAAEDSSPAKYIASADVLAVPTLMMKPGPSRVPKPEWQLLLFLSPPREPGILSQARVIPERDWSQSSLL